jgi:hypothetical protein
MDGRPTREFHAGPLASASVETALSRVIDASFAVLLLATPLLAVGRGRQAFALLAVIAVGGALVLLQRGSRVKRLSRCSWLVFLAVGTSIFLATRVSDPAFQANGIRSAAAAAVGVAACAALLAWALKLAAGRRLPPLADAFDWGAAVTIGILVVAGAAFAALGYSGAVAALAMPAAVILMHLVVREQCANLRRARRLVQIAMVSAMVALVGWSVIV